MSELVVFLVTYLSLDSLPLPVSAHSGFRLWLASSSDEGSLPEKMLSDASKLALTYFLLLNRSVHVSYTEIYPHCPVMLFFSHSEKIIIFV